MSTYNATVCWSRNGQPFLNNQYKRVHQWKFDSGQTIRASASPNIVPPPLSDASAVDPEEAFVAALSSCHMLWFLSIAAQAGFVIDRYEDRAKGVLEKNNFGKKTITEVTLVPRIHYQNHKAPSLKKEEELHQKADDQCYIANSVKTTVTVDLSKKP